MLKKELFYIPDNLPNHFKTMFEMIFKWNPKERATA